MLHFYGLKPETIDYGLYVGLKMNLGRLRWHSVWATMQGIKAFLAEQLPEQLFDAIAPTDDAAAEMTFDANLELSRRRAEQAARRMAGQ